MQSLLRFCPVLFDNLEENWTLRNEQIDESLSWSSSLQVNFVDVEYCVFVDHAGDGGLGGVGREVVILVRMMALKKHTCSTSPT